MRLGRCLGIAVLLVLAMRSARACGPFGDERSVVDRVWFSEGGRLFAVRTSVTATGSAPRAVWRIFDERNVERPLFDVAFYPDRLGDWGLWREALPTSLAFLTLNRLAERATSLRGSDAKCRSSIQPFACEDDFSSFLSATLDFRPLPTVGSCAVRFDERRMALIGSKKGVDVELGDADALSANAGAPVTTTVAACVQRAGALKAVVLRSEGTLGFISADDGDDAASPAPPTPIRFVRERLVSWDPANAESRRRRWEGEAASARGEYTRARHALEKAFALDPASFGTGLALAAVMARQGSTFQEAHAAAEAAVTVVAARDAVLNRFADGSAFAPWRRDPSFVAWLEKKRSENPIAGDPPVAAETEHGSARTDRALGLASCADGRMSEAESYFRRALLFEPEYVEARLDLAGVLAAEDRPGDAYRELSTAYGRSPSAARARVDADGDFDSLSQIRGFRRLFADTH